MLQQVLRPHRLGPCNQHPVEQIVGDRDRGVDVIPRVRVVVRGVDHAEVGERELLRDLGRDVHDQPDAVAVDERAGKVGGDADLLAEDLGRERLGTFHHH